MMTLIFNRVALDGSSAEECMTCSVDFDGCQYASASMSPDNTYYILSCLGPDVPTYSLYHSNGTMGELFASYLNSGYEINN